MDTDDAAITGQKLIPLSNARILVVHPGSELYGSDRVLLESVIALIGQNAQVTVALPSTGPLVALLHEAGANAIISRTLVLRKEYLRFKRLPSLVWASLRGTIAGLRLLRRAQPDAVYVNTVTMPLWPPLARIMRIPVLTHVHEGERSSATLVRKLLYLPHLASTTVIFNSEFSRSVVATVYPRMASRGVTVYNGVVGPSNPFPPRESIEGPLRVLFVGRLSPRKGVDLLVSSVRLLADRQIPVHLGLLGATFGGYEWYESHLRNMIREAALTDRVDFYGFHNEIWPFLAEADVLVVPSRLDEPFGNTAVESILAARPVIASDTSGLREATAGFNAATLIQPDSAEHLAEALTRVSAEWSENRLLAISDAASARSRFSPEQYRSEVAREVTKILDTGTRQGSKRFRAERRVPVSESPECTL